MARRCKRPPAVKRPHWIVFVLAYFIIMHVIYGREIGFVPVSSSSPERPHLGA